MTVAVPVCGWAPSRSRATAEGFTLLELLAVVAIIGVLAAILIPTVNAARVSAHKARTRVQFNQWSTAIELFRSEYGHYPVFAGANLVNAGADGAEHVFHDTLAGRRRDGTPLTSGSTALAQNPKRIAFHGFPEAEFAAPDAHAPQLLCDPLGNTEIAVLVDRNLDGVIDATDFGTLPLVRGLRPDESVFPAAGVRAGVVFYATLPGATAERPEFVLSWK
ncbi:type II secretion system protein [Opitutus terrae]|uniref:Prepilin-type N-terminal cleavage/methylation domain-containing protein n=1 Tax=Opitutus terrae (strain DSM 11246 / JCM 15787 / PB90-1) TaxID=452637 RepID=B1ZYB3_OPITP|nr:prepilin-type N-terminal cleavage/methylation domain-containing protein [Opitutus terrae]ACB77011.1 hypothetical protein Oter_3736 [Opitutus terrae PB90-1]